MTTLLMRTAGAMCASQPPLAPKFSHALIAEALAQMTDAAATQKRFSYIGVARKIEAMGCRPQFEPFVANELAAAEAQRFDGYKSAEARAAAVAEEQTLTSAHQLAREGKTAEALALIEPITDRHGRQLYGPWTIIDWHIDAGDLALARNTYDAVDWKSRYTRIQVGISIAVAHVKHGDEDAANDLMTHLEQSAGLGDEPETIGLLLNLAEKRAMFRDDRASIRLRNIAAQRAFARALRDHDQPIVGFRGALDSVIQAQIDAGDIGAAKETLSNVQTLAVGIDGPAVDVRRMSGLAIVSDARSPNARRWLPALPVLARLHARVGDDNTAFRMAEAAPYLTVRAMCVESIGLGQAQRGDLAAAFRSLDAHEALSTDVALEQARYDSPEPKVVDRNTVEVRPLAPGKALRPFDLLWHRVASHALPSQIALLAAARGDVLAMWQAVDRIGRSVSATAPPRDPNSPQVLVMDALRAQLASGGDFRALMRLDADAGLRALRDQVGPDSIEFVVRLGAAGITPGNLAFFADQLCHRLAYSDQFDEALKIARRMPDVKNRARALVGIAEVATLTQEQRRTRVASASAPPFAPW